MNDKYRVLAYKKAQDLKFEELTTVSGGASLLSVEITHRVSGSYPGQVTLETDQIYDH